MACGRTLALLLLQVSVSTSLAFAGQPSYDCAKARSWSEIAVCNDDALADLDRQVAELYRSRGAALSGEERKNLIRDQRKWLQQREQCRHLANPSACLIDVYHVRIAQLGGETERDQRSGAGATGQTVGSGTLTTKDGETVSYRPSSKGAPFVEFQVYTKGYRNTYTLNCASRQFLWTKNVLLATGKDTGNSAGAEWRALSPNSTLSNAVYRATCPHLLAGTSAITAPPSVIVDRGVCPGEGCTYGTWLAEKPVSLRSRPKDDSPIISTIEKGEYVEARTGEVHGAPGKFVVRKPHGKYKVGDVIWVYSYAGEGMFKVRFGEQTYEQDLGFSPYGGSSGSRCEKSTDCWGELANKLRSTWWVQVKTRNGTTGWTSDTAAFRGKSIYDRLRPAASAKKVASAGASPADNNLVAAASSGAGQGTSASVACGDTKFQNLTPDEGKALKFVLERKQDLQGIACITDLVATDKFPLRGQTVIKYRETVVFPKGYATGCLKQHSFESGGFGGFLKQLDCSQPGMAPARPGEVRHFSGDEII